MTSLSEPFPWEHPPAPDTEFWRAIDKYRAVEYARNMTEEDRTNMSAAPDASNNDRLNLIAQVLERTLTALQNELGPENEQTVKTMSALVNVYGELGRYPESEAVCRKIIAIKEKQNPEIVGKLAPLSNLPFIVWKQGRLQEAEAMYREQLPELEGKLGKDSPQVLGTLRALTEILAQEGRFEEAEKMAGEVSKTIKLLSEGRYSKYEAEEEEALEEVVKNINTLKEQEAAA